MTIKEARFWLRHAVKVLNEQSVTLKRETRVKGRPPSPSDQAMLRTTQLRLTVLHAMLAYSRGRLHAVDGNYDVTKMFPGHASVELLKTRVRQWIETRGEIALDYWWVWWGGPDGHHGQLPPALKTVWSAVSLIPDLQARDAAVHMGGPPAGYR